MTKARTIPAIDPFYAADRVSPDSSGLSLFSEEPHGPHWLYLKGDLEAWLLNRIRHEAFHACLNVYHPGRFRTGRPILYARRRLHLADLPADCRVRIACCGNLHLTINGLTVLHTAGKTAPEFIEIDLRPHLVIGDIEVSARVHSLNEPPTLLVAGRFLQSDAAWEVGCDDLIFERPNTLPFAGEESFPHQERLPEAILTPKAVGDGLWDFGVEVYGRPEAKVRGQGTLTFHPGESKAEALDADPARREQLVPTLSLRAGRVNSPVELALRFLRVEHSPDLQLEDVRLRASTCPVCYRGAFKSSDPLLDQVWMHAAYTLRLCMRELFVDGIKRDRLPWVGDLYLAGLSNAFSFFDAGIMRRSLIALYGAEPERVDFNGIIDYSFFWILALHEYVLHFGDLAFLEEVLPLLERLLNALEARRDSSGLIPAAACGWLFIDWAPVDKAGYSSCLEFLSIQATEAASHLMGFLGRQETADLLADRVRNRRRAARDLFWSESDGAFRDCTGSDRAGRHANILAALSGTAAASDRRRLVSRFLGDAAAPPVGTPYMRSLEAVALARCGLRAEMVSGIRDYWGGMIQAGASSFWERYDAAGSDADHLAMYGRRYGASLCHAWSSGPVFLLSRELFGLKPLAPGWSRFTLHPKPVGLARCSAVVPTPNGPIRLAQGAGQIVMQFPKGVNFEINGKTTPGPECVTLNTDGRRARATS